MSDLVESGVGMLTLPSLGNLEVRSRPLHEVAPSILLGAHRHGILDTGDFRHEECGARALLYAPIGALPDAG